MTNTTTVTCPKCSKTLNSYSTLFQHNRVEHPTPGQKAADTRRRNQEAKAQRRAEAEARMEAASKPVLRRGDNFLRWTYQADTNTYRPYRTITPGALTRIQACEAAIESARASLAREMAEAWEHGTPVTQAEIDVARAAGETP